MMILLYKRKTRKMQIRPVLISNGCITFKDYYMLSPLTSEENGHERHFDRNRLQYDSGF